MTDPELELVKAIRHSRDRLPHEFLCPACAHRDHTGCDGRCAYCDAICQCVCRRWSIPVPGVDD